MLVYVPCHVVCLTGMGGAYLTLLNTIANMGVILPKTPLFAAMDWLTVSQCHDLQGHIVKGLTCPKKIRLLAGSSPCTDAGEAWGWAWGCSREHGLTPWQHAWIELHGHNSTATVLQEACESHVQQLCYVGSCPHSTHVSS